MPAHPYSNLPAPAFWRSGVADLHPLNISGLWHPKHPLKPSHRIVTAGSCFAQHIGRALAARGYNWFDAEPAPKRFKDETKRRFNYGVFSFRTGNIYTAAALRQWLGWALEGAAPPAEYWKSNGRFYDPFRPNIEPDGFASEDELLASRQSTLAAIQRAVENGRRFVFTMGLTEGWVNRELGHVYAMCPGTVAGEFDPEVHHFRNYRFREILADIEASIRIIKSRNRAMKFLLTVSPVPLTATATGEHVLTATVHSKSVLRAVAGELASKRADTDYFPSYEIITAPAFRGMFYEPNMRSVTPRGVDFVMESFFDCLARQGARDDAHAPAVARSPRSGDQDKSADDVVCEEEMLDAFGGAAR